MLLINRIDADSIAALKAGNKDLRRVLVFLSAEAKKIGKDDGNRQSTNEEVVRVLRKQIANLEENIRLSDSRGPAIAAWRGEIEILQSYLPKQMDEAELTAHIKAFITGQNWSDEKPSMKWMGSVMVMLKETIPGQYDPAMASKIAKTLLQG